MEGEKRDQKLKAGKEKLAQFQRKKRKKKPRIDETGSSPPIAEATISPSANAESDPAFLLDSDTLTISSCSEDDTDSAQEWSSRAQLQLKSKLQAKSQRVEELEESLVGKQLALDKVIQENEKLKTLMKHVDHTDVSDANHNPVENMAENQNQSCYANGTVENQQVEDGSHKGTENGTGSQEFSMSDVQELLHHVQWLQLQLKQANNTLQTQNRKQKETADALLHAKEEIVLLQDSITHKDKLLNELVEKMTIISKEYGSLKQNYAQLSDSRKESLNEEIEKERNLRCEVETALKNEVQMTKSENEHKIQELLEKEEERLGKVTEEYDIKIKDLESQLEEFQTRNEENKLNSEKIMNENAGLQSYCDTLTKGLEFMKEEHEKAMTELNELSVGFKVLKSEYDILVEEKGQCELQAESLKAELDTIKAEREQVLDQISSLKNVNGSLEKDIKDTCEKFERIKHEHHKLLTDNTVLADEIVKLKEDNAMYQSQIAEYEGKLSESEEIFDENHSLHGQNDELNNKINNQKDVIASIKNELEVLTMENSQYVSQMKDLSTGLQQTKKENGDLKAENEQLQSEVTNLKDMLSLLEEESLQYKDNQLVLNEEIQNLKQCLAKSSTESSAKVPLLLASKQNKIQSFETDKSEIKSDYEEHIMVNEELIVAQEVLSQSEAIPQVFIRHRVDEGDKTFKHDDADENSDTNRKLVSEESSVSDFAKISESDNKVTELEEEIKRLNTVIIEIQASTVSKEDVTSSKKLLQNDLSNETGNKLDTMSAVSNSNDTAYESLHYEHTHLNQVETEYADSEVDVLAERLLNMQQEFKLVTQALHHKTKECEDLHHELQRLTQKQLPAIPTPTDVCGDILIDNGEKQKVSELPKVSETSSVTSLEKEVNMHASSSLCSVQNDGVVTLGTLDSLPGIMCKGDSDIYVDQDTFQNVTEDAVDETRHLDVPQKELDKMDSKEYEPEYGVPESLSKELTEIKEQIQIQEMETIKWKDAYDQMLNKSTDLIKSVELVKSREESLKHEIESKEEIVAKLRKDQENSETVVAECQVKMKKLDDIAIEREERMKELTYENEKLTWERDEMNESVSDLEKQLLEMKTMKCDIEFQKVQYEEELSRVKERLEYLESSDNDIIEIKDMLEKLQEERENIIRENEKLQCSLSAQIEENEKLLETMECLHKENATFLEKIEVSSVEIRDLSKELAESKLVIGNYEDTLKEVTSEKESQESRFESEIEGLLEENSTLKTNVQMKNVECETLKADNERLQSFFPNIDQESENNSLLKMKNLELEEREKELGKENEHLIAELMETQSKVAEIAEENELLLDKCEEFQRIIGELDDEKTSLLESVERTRLDINDKLKENDSIIEKYENQLECLDQENSTLKTQILSLHQEIEDNLQTENENAISEAKSLKREKEILQQENQEYKEKMNGLEQDLLGLVEQVKLYEATVTEKEDVSLRLEGHIQELLQENAQLKEKYVSIETDFHDLKNTEIYLKEQMKVYESALNSEGGSSGQEVDRLNAQLELERKYKAKFEKDLKHAQNRMNYLENEYKDMKDKNDLLEKELKLAVDKNNEAEKIACKMNGKLNNALLDKQDLMNEKCELQKSFNEVSKRNEVLKVEVCTLQNHLQAVSDNRNHVRNQIEILAAEVEHLRDTNALMQAHDREISTRYTVMISECNTLSEKMSLIAEENEKLQSTVQKLEVEIEDNKCADRSVEDSIRENLSGITEEVNELRNENESLTLEIKKLKVELTEKEEMCEATNELLIENETLTSENEDLKQQNDELKSNFQCLREKLVKLDELIERNKAAELDNDALVERLDVLHKKISEIQKEKQSLQVMTDDLTTMLHDMQTKYEEVKSEMESTKKKCDKEINHLQNQLHEMNEDVSELRKMLDYMENEMYNNAEEKNILKENLEQQQSQFAEVCEQKQKLEEILSDKQQKDLKNMQMASQRHKNNELNTSRNEQDLPCSEQSTLQDDGNQPGAREISDHPLTEVLRDSMDSDLSDILPSFESALHLFGLASSGETVHSSRMVQTNISVREGENIGFLLNDTENDKEFVKKDIETQTETPANKTVKQLSLEVFPNIDIDGIDLELPLNQSPENEISHANMCTSDLTVGDNVHLVSYNCSDRNENIPVLLLTPEAHRAEMVTYTEETVDMYKGDEMDVSPKEMCHSSNQTESQLSKKCDIASQVEFQRKSVSCQIDIPFKQSSENTRLLSFVIDNDENTLDTFPADISVLSADSGILSACAGADGKNQPFQYPGNNFMKNSADVTVQNLDQNKTNDFGQIDKVDGNDLDHIAKEIQFSEICIQTDISFEGEVEIALANLKENVEAEFKEKSKELETDIETRVLKNMEFREKKIQLLEESYDKKVKQMEYDIEEKYEHKFRMREVEIVMEADRDKKAQAAEVKNAAEIEIEKIKREKDQQFVETLQKVKADLAKQQGREAGVIRAVSHDSPRRKSDLEMGPSGDVKKQHEGTFHKLAQEHEELALERDALLEKIKVTQTEQEILCQQLVGIMGEHSTMSNDKQQKYQQTPSWLDWDLHPDFSFGSMRSSLDTKSLSGSLDTSSFCSNSDCLNVRMKYEHLIDKIQQFLKVRSSHVQIDGTEPVKTRAVDDGDVEDSDTQAEGGDRFEENDEPESQMLHRITSIDLETFVRIPKTAEKKSVDQFVYEADDPSSTVELNRDIIDRLVKDSNDSKMEQFNIEGRFSENEESDDENEGDMLDNTEILHKVNQGRSSVSFVEDDGHFYQEDSFQLMRKKRHFSDSDIKGDEKNSKIQTSQSENNEGHFVFERLDSQVEKHKTGKDDVYAAESVDDDDDDDVDDDGVFKELEENNITKLISAPVVSTGIQSAKELKMKVDQFINENNDDKPPGSQEVVISARSEPRTGEETGDFFEEKIVKSVVLSQSAVRNKDATAKSETSRQDLKNVEQNLENDLSSVKQEYRHGQQSYENTVFDILNSICPGTDPGRRPGTSAVTEDTFHPVKREQENTVDEFSESSSSVETDMQSLKAELSNMKLELISLTKENSQLKDAIKVKELGNKKDVEVLVEQISELEEINRQQVSDMLQAGREFESQKLDAEQFKNLEQANKDLSVELDKCRELVTCLELDLKQNSNDSQELETLKNELGEERSEKMILKTQYIQMEKMKNESEQKYFEVSSHNDKLISDFRMLDSSVKTLETDMLLLEEEKSKLVNENDSLKFMNENNSKLLQKHEELKMNVTQLQNEKEYLDAELKKKTAVLQVEKDELEKTLIAQSDMYDRLEKSVKVMDIDNKKLKEHLETVIKENETLKEKMEIEVNENMSLKKELEKEISMKMEIKVKEEELNSELFALKHELDIKYTGLISENEKLKVTADEASANINVLKEEKEELNNIIQNIKIKENEKEMLLQDKDIIIAELNQSKQSLIEQVEKLKVNTEALQANCNEMTEKVIELEKENDVLHSCEVESSALKKINEDLRNELIKITERSEENEWAIRELTEQVENQKKPEMTERSTEVDNMEEIAENKSKTLSTEKGAFSFSQQNGSNICLVESFTNTDSCSGNEIEEVTALKEEVGALTSENSTLKQKMKEMSISDNFKEELESLKLENETLKRSLEFAMVKDDSDTDLQIFEDMKDAIKTMQAEKSSVEQHEKEMSDNMEQENKRLRDEVEELYVENDELKKKLKSQEESARKENGEILKMYSDLRNEVEILVISKHDLEIELHALKDLLEHDSYSTREKTEHDTSRELTLEDLEEMEELKTSIEKLKSDLKEKDIYVKKLEEHFLNLDGNMPDLTSTPKPSSSRGMPLISKSFMKRGHYWSSGSSRRAYSHDIPTVNVEKEFNENSIKPDLERSQTLDTSLHVGDLDRSKNSERNFNEGLRTKEKLTSSTLTDSLDRSSYLGSVGGSERIRSGLKAEEDGHLALELKQFELVAEITKLRRDFRETKSLYSKETALLTEALEKEKLANELRGMSELTLEHSVGSNLSHDVLKLRKEVARLREQNKLLHLDCDRWIERLKEQEQIVADLKERINQNTSGYGEIEEVFGRQLALLQKQREELIDKLKDREKENISLSETLGEKGILEETLRKEKDVLVAKLKEKEKIEEELCEKKMLLEKQTAKQKELEDVVYQKDLNEIELMKQKRILEEDLREIESRFRDKEENLDFEKNKLLNELREKRTKSIRSRFSESDDEVSSVCSESAAFSDRNIGRLEVMLEEVEKQHSVAVNVLRDQLRVKYNRREKELRKEHLVGLERLKQDSRKQVK